MQTWTDAEERRLWPYVLRRCHPDELHWIALWVHKRPVQVRRHRRELRHRARRVQGLAGRAGRLAA